MCIYYSFFVDLIPVQLPVQDDFRYMGQKARLLRKMLFLVRDHSKTILEQLKGQGIGWMTIRFFKVHILSPTFFILTILTS